MTASYLEILGPTLIVIGFAGLLLDSNPVYALIGLIAGGYALCLLIGVFLEAVIVFLLTFRRELRRWWESNTPPYPDIERDGLPTTDMSVSMAQKRTRIYLEKFTTVYILSIGAAVYIVLSRPEWMRELMTSPLVKIAVAVILFLMQIPPALLQLPGVSKAIPPTDVWNNLVRIVLLVPCIPFAAVFVSNFRYVLYRKRQTMYLHIFGSFSQILRGGISSHNVTRKQAVAAVIDSLLFVLVVALVRVNL